jgi:hypothetical protein
MWKGALPNLWSKSGVFTEDTEFKIIRKWLYDKVSLEM